MKKKYSLMIMVLLVFVFSLGVVSSDTIKASYTNVKLYINNQQMKNPVVMVDGKLYMEILETVNMLKLNTKVDEENNTVYLSNTDIQATADNYLYIVADDKKSTYLGKLTTDKYDTESIYNEYGNYGSKYSNTSIWNQYGEYGGKYSTYSPYNAYTSTPPKIYNQDGEYIGRLTVNETIADAIHPDTLYKYLTNLGY